MAYLVLSNLILVLVPMILMFVSKKSKYPEKIDFFFSLITLLIIVFGFIPEHLSSMTLNNVLLVVVVFLALEIIERIESVEKLSGSKKVGRAYFTVAFLLITFHAFLDGMGFHLESALSNAESHGGHQHAEAHNHDYYSLSLGLLLHRFPIGVLIYQKFFTDRAMFRKGFTLVLGMIVATCIGYLNYQKFAKVFGAEKFSHAFEYFIVALLLHFVVTHIYNRIRNEKC